MAMEISDPMAITPATVVSHLHSNNQTGSQTLLIEEQDKASGNPLYYIIKIAADGAIQFKQQVQYIRSENDSKQNEHLQNY